MIEDIYTKVEPLPGKIHGFTKKGFNCYTVVLNANDSEARRLEAYNHEIRHIRRDDFDSEKGIQLIEDETH